MMSVRAFTADYGLIESDGLPARVVAQPYLEVDANGRILRVETSLPSEGERPALVHDLGRCLLLPGFVNAHSHAFQRRIRGMTGRQGKNDPSSFWSWREAMYAAAGALDPEGVYLATRACFDEMLRAGITCVGEFHYVHHQPGGTPYDDPNELSKQVIRAASDVGIRLVLLEVYYARAGAGREPLPEQRRFCDGSTDAYLSRLDALRNYEGDFHLGVTPHSIRAVSAPELRELADYARRHDLPIHAHVSEQPRENEECRAEHDSTPTEAFAAAGCLDRPGRFTAVHAIHVSTEDRRLLADQQVCACPSTEADLGDGIIPAADYLSDGCTLALGSDSNSVIDLIQEARLLEMHERLARQSRLVLRNDEGQVAPYLAAAATIGGAKALARPELGRLAVNSPFDAVALDLGHRTLRDVPPDFLLDAVFLAGQASPVAQVWVNGQRRV